MGDGHGLAAGRKPARDSAGASRRDRESSAVARDCPDAPRATRLLSLDRRHVISGSRAASRQNADNAAAGIIGLVRLGLLTAVPMPGIAIVMRSSRTGDSITVRDWPSRGRFMYFDAAAGGCRRPW